MKKILVALWTLGAMASVSYAGEVGVTWQDLENFTDIRPSNETPGDLRERLIKELDQVFVDLARELPDGYYWSVKVTDLDLAGEVRPLFRRWMSEVRVVKTVDWPRMAFSFELKDPHGQIIASANETVDDMGFLMHAATPIGRTSFKYEERMLRDWFHAQQRQKVFPIR